MDTTKIADSSSDQPTSPKVSSALFAMRGWRKWLLLIAGWTFLGLAQAPRQWAIYCIDGVPWVPWKQAAMWAMGEWYMWGLLSLLIVRITAWIAVDRKNWVRAGLAHLGLGILIGLVHIYLYSMILVGLRLLYDLQVGMTFDSIWPWFTGAIWTRLHGAVLTYALIAFVCYAIRYYRRYSDEQKRLVAVEGRLAEARLQALKMQLHPHFLFNTLNAITALIHTEPKTADQMTTRLSDLLRVALDSESVQEVSLRKELAFLDGYLEIQQLRFQDRLIVNREIAGETLDARVPNLILQPLVENAVQHGVSRGSGQGEITIT
ncbi:MAG: histidine kinase, partial [candidate division Zixibacteria bacterium]|nr:histidine kinase [candidate division Zixibacteria bacterium]